MSPGESYYGHLSETITELKTKQNKLEEKILYLCQQMEAVHLDLQLLRTTSRFLAKTLTPREIRSCPRDCNSPI